MRAVGASSTRNATSMLDPELKARLEQRLASRRRQLEADVRDKLAAAREVVGTGAIDQLIEGGTYGVCIDCGEEIAPSRLEAYPTAGRCIACQSGHEARVATPNLRRL